MTFSTITSFVPKLREKNSEKSNLSEFRHVHSVSFVRISGDFFRGSCEWGYTPVNYHRPWQSSGLEESFPLKHC
jgi:hypothetical protein